MKKYLFITLSCLIMSATLFATPPQDSNDTGSLSVNMSTGTFTSTNANGTYASVWTSTSTEPVVTLSIGVNNMATNGDNLSLYYTNSNNAGTYTLSVSEGFAITGYAFDFTNANTSNNMTVTPNGGTAVTCEGTGSAQVEVSDLELRSATFTVSAASPAVVAINTSNFVVYYKQAEVENDFQYLFYTYDEEGVPYRIPAISKLRNGELIALADKRYCNSDIGYGHIDVVARMSSDNGDTWGKQFTILDGNGISGDNACGYGDAAMVADCESDTIFIMCCTGNTPYGASTRSKPLRTARCYSYDGGKTWTAPEDVTEEIYGLFDSRPGGSIAGMFFGSGRIFQSKTIKVGSHFRIYSALCTRSGNFMLYSDNFGREWKCLGKTKNSCASNGDEPKCEELPNGNVVLSSRASGGRIFNIFAYTNVTTGAGNWRTAVTSKSQTGGISVGANATNGEIFRLKATRNADGESVYVMLQSLPAADGRYNVTIFYKELASEEDYDTPIHFAQDWDGSYQVSYTVSAYSTMELQADKRIAFFYEESPNVYSLVYKPLTLETITNGAYTIEDEEFVNKITVVKEDEASDLSALGGKGVISLSANKQTSVQICDTNGKLLFSKELSENEEHDIPFPEGVYLVNNNKVLVK